MKLQKTCKTRARLAFAIVLSLLRVAAMAEDEPSLSEALFNGDPVGNIRVRYEHADTSSTEQSEALTLRTRLGYATRPYRGFSAFVELEDVQALNDSDDYSQAGLNEEAQGKTVIGDVEGTELNKAYLFYTTEDKGFMARAGRQRILSGACRYAPMNTYWIDRNFVWRQNEQTMDAVTLRASPWDNVTLFYGYVDNIYRPFGHERGSSPAGEKMNAAEIYSDSHMANISYTPRKEFATTFFTYWVNLGDGAFAAMNSSDTLGLDLTGDIQLGDAWTLRYVADYAHQSDNGGSSPDADFGVDYYKIGVSGATGRLRVGAYHEILDTDGGFPFRSALATPHKVNGWADVFVVTPKAGLVDTCASAHYGTKKGHRAIAKYHTFSSASGSDDYGTEIDLLVSWKVTRNLSFLAKYAQYQADSRADNPAGNDVERFWLSTDIYF